jgi:hypothetical protein
MATLKCHSVLAATYSGEALFLSTANHAQKVACLYGDDAEFWQSTAT